MKLVQFAQLLKQACENTSHYESESDGYPRVIYAETGRNYYWADNRPSKKTFKVDVHFYTRTEFDPVFEALEDLFIENGIPFDLEGIQYGKDVDGRDGVIYSLFKCEV